jgi:hypothetical protein
MNFMRPESVSASGVQAGCQKALSVGGRATRLLDRSSQRSVKDGRSYRYLARLLPTVDEVTADADPDVEGWERVSERIIDERF